MLVISRCKNEVTRLYMRHSDGSHTLLGTVRIVEGKCRLGFEFPQNVIITRSECDNLLDTAEEDAA